ncbi:MAG: hypothetical protein DRP74_05145 [Candidatus Omnitrophota bacterium]|nr:MAG: hypothetical protein DRP74_05145 [Candidatus Omnitrophota bacterium]
MSYTWKSPRNLISFALIIVILALLAVQVGASFYITENLPQINKELSNFLGHNLKIKRASFNLITGLHLYDFSVYFSNRSRASLLASDIFIRIKILPLIFKKVVVRRVSIKECILLPKREEEGINLQIIFSDLYKKSKLDTPLPFGFKLDTDNLSLTAREAKVIPAAVYRTPQETHLLFKNAAILVYRANKIKFKGEVTLKYQIPQEKYVSRFLDQETSHFIQKAKCNMESNIIGDNMKIDLLVLNIGPDQIFCTGTIKDFAEKNPLMSIASVPTFISLENIDFFKDNFQAKGHIFITFFLAGPMDNTKASFESNISRCSFKYHMADMEEVNLTNINGEAKFANKTLSSPNLTLKINGVPLNIGLKISLLKTPQFYVSLSVAKEFLASRGVPLESLEFSFDGKLENTIKGNLKIKSLYKRKRLILDMNALLRNIDFDYYNLTEKFFKAEKIELTKKSEEGIQKLIFSDFDSKVKLTKNLLKINHIKFKGYQGIFNGLINLDFASRKQPQLNISLSGSGIDVKSLMQDAQLSENLRSGTMDVRIRFNNILKRFVEGRCYIKKGVMDLGALSDAVKFPPLDNTNFDIMHIYFAVTRQNIIARGLKLLSPELKLNAFWDLNSKVTGVINLKVDSVFLKKSKQFRQLLSLTKIKSPYINFKFLLGGIPDALRLMWMKGEFKNKLEETLPKGIIASIETSLDKTIEELSAK